MLIKYIFILRKKNHLLVSFLLKQCFHFQCSYCKLATNKHLQHIKQHLNISRSQHLKTSKSQQDLFSADFNPNSSTGAGASGGCGVFRHVCRILARRRWHGRHGHGRHGRIWYKLRCHRQPSAGNVIRRADGRCIWVGGGTCARRGTGTEGGPRRWQGRWPLPHIWRSSSPCKTSSQALEHVYQDLTLIFTHATVFWFTFLDNSDRQRVSQPNSSTITHKTSWPTYTTHHWYKYLHMVNICQCSVCSVSFLSFRHSS
jgi:hypothetical protein